MNFIHRLCLVVVFALITITAQAQTPVNIRQVGDTSIGATVPVSGTVTTTLCTTGTCAEGAQLVWGAATTVYVGTGSTIYSLATTSGTTAVITTGTITANFIKITNTTNASINFTATDNAGTPLLEETTFAIPAFSTYYMCPPGCFLKYAGLQLYGSATGLRLHLSALQ